MTILFVLITASAFVAGIFLFAFIWSVKTGQFDDTHTPAVRAIFDDAKPITTETEKTEDNNSNKNETE